MNRRRFLTWLTCTAAGAALADTIDVDRLLWTPGSKRIFLPPEPPAPYTVTIDVGRSYESRSVRFNYSEIPVFDDSAFFVAKDLQAAVNRMASQIEERIYSSLIIGSEVLHVRDIDKYKIGVIRGIGG